MARGGYVIEESGRKTKRGAAAFATVGRHLRETSMPSPLAPLWPLGEGGRSKGTHVDASNIVNLFVGVAVSDPFSAAHRLVLAYRNAFLREPLPVVMGEKQKWSPILPSRYLGVALDWLVDALAGPDAKKVRLRYADIRVSLVVGRPGLGTVRLGKREDQYEARDEADAGASSSTSDEGGIDLTFDRIATLELKHFSLMAEFWADTLAHRTRVTSSSGGSSTSATPEDENADTLPEVPASIGSRTRKRRSKALNSPDTAAEKEKTQASGACGSDCLPLFSLEVIRDVGSCSPHAHPA